MNEVEFIELFFDEAICVRAMIGHPRIYFYSDTAEYGVGMISHNKFSNTELGVNDVYRIFNNSNSMILPLSTIKMRSYHE